MVPIKLAHILVLSLCLIFSGCNRNRSFVRVPVTGLPSPDYAGPAPEIENQATSAAFMVDTLPEPAATAAETQPILPPPLPHTQPIKPAKAATEPKRESRLSVAPVETRPVVQAPPIELFPQFSGNDKQTLNRKITDQLDSARFLVRTLDESQLTAEQKPSLVAVHDFIRKSEDAVRRGEFHQGLVLAQKANTIAASLAKTP